MKRSLVIACEEQFDLLNGCDSEGVTALLQSVFKAITEFY
jgi:hypothetical protein